LTTLAQPLRERDKVLIGIADVAQTLGVRLTKTQSWQAGNRARDEYVAVVGSLPPKQLVPKRNGEGSHMKAAYPIAWTPRIVAIIHEVQVETRVRQIDLLIDCMPGDGFPF
jgi:hypothetical protein